jgi:hypothetical protein
MDVLPTLGALELLGFGVACEYLGHLPGYQLAGVILAQGDVDSTIAADVEHDLHAVEHLPLVLLGPVCHLLVGWPGQVILGVDGVPDVIWVLGLPDQPQ